MELNDVPLPDDFESLSKLLTTCETARNLVGHGVWLNNNNELCVQNPSGEWVSENEAKVSRRKYPQAFFPDEAWLSQTLADIKTAIHRLEQLGQHLEASLPPLPKKGE